MNDNLHLEYVEATTYDSVKFSGDSKPLGMICTRINDGFDIPCVVKLREDLPYKEHSCAREAICSMIACYWGLRVPQPFVVHISNEFTNSIVDNEIGLRCRKSIGDNFGSKTIEKELLPFDNVSKDKLQDALEIFAFDALIQNSDRSKIKRNLFQDPIGFILIDHEKAFPFSKPYGLFGGFPEPCDLLDLRYAYLREHLVYKFIRREPYLDFGKIMEKVSSLTSTFVDTIINTLPKKWQSDEMDIIRTYLINVSSNSDQFVKNLREFLG